MTKSNAVKIGDWVDVIGDEDCEDFHGEVKGFREGFVLVADQEDVIWCVESDCVWIDKED